MHWWLVVFFSDWSFFFFFENRSAEKWPVSCHLVTVDHVKSSGAVSNRLGLAAVVVGVTDARGRTSPVVSAAALWVDQECGGRLCNHLARLAPAASLELQTNKKKNKKQENDEKMTSLRSLLSFIFFWTNNNSSPHIQATHCAKKGSCRIEGSFIDRHSPYWHNQSNRRTGWECENALSGLADAALFTCSSPQFILFSIVSSVPFYVSGRVSANSGT